MNTKLMISELLKDLGISPALKGYHCLRYAIEISVEDQDCRKSITRVLYPKVAEALQTTPSRVERVIRHAIEVGWSRGNIGLQEKLFGFSVDAAKGKPSNGEFVATIVDYLLVHREAEQDGD